MSDTTHKPRAPEVVDRVIIRFAGDSGDGMQLTGDRFTTSSALYGNDLATLPDFPAEIRAPAGTMAGVSAFQVHISDHDITTPGDAPNVLVAMNPAALRSQIGRVAPGATIILNADAFDERSMTKAGYAADPRTDGSLDGYTVYEVPMTSLTRGAVEPLGVKTRDAERSKNFFALGLISWMYTRPVDPTLEWIQLRFVARPKVAEANTVAFKAGHAFGETAELFDHPYEVKPAALPPGTYTNINGNTALAWGLVAASQLSGLPLFLGSYPITPASDILHELSKHKNFGVRTLQAEDEIAGIGAALGAAYAGNLGVTTTSGPGMALKAETMGLAVNLELPLLIIDIQRGGPSTGLPTKTEQADLLMAFYGRHGEAPLPILAPRSPSHCFEVAIEAARIALTWRTPVILLSDGYLANGTEPWRLPDVDALPDLSVTFATEPNHTDGAGEPVFWPYRARPRDPGAGVGAARHPRADAPHRRPREGGRVGQHQLRPRQPRAHGAAAGREGGPGRGLDPAGRGARRRRRRRPAGRRVGVDVGRHRRRGRPGPALGAPDRPPAPHAPQPVPAEPRRRAEALPAGDGARDEPGPARPPAPRRVPRRRPGGDPGAGPAVHRRRARAGDHRSAQGQRMTDTLIPVTTRKDWSSDQEVRWCPGCGDYSILAAVQLLMPDLGIRREDTVFVSGIGCAARLPYYMNTYGMHTIHGRAPAIATGLALARPDLHVFVVSGDGDALSIGGNHLIHALRRNVNITILLFNNQIYGLTKGQYSPTSEVGKVTKSTPFGSLDHPFNPVSVAIGAEATFVARTHDMDRRHMMETIRRAFEHRGASLVEIYQNCNVFNDAAFEGITGKQVRDDMLIPLRHGEPIRFGAEGQRGVVIDSQRGAHLVDVAEVGEDALLVHDETRDDPSVAFMLSRLARGPYEPTPIGVFRDVVRTDYGEGVEQQIAAAQAERGAGDLKALLRSGATWEVG